MKPIQPKKKAINVPKKPNSESLNVNKYHSSSKVHKQKPKPSHEKAEAPEVFLGMGGRFVMTIIFCKNSHFYENLQIS